MSEFVWRTGSCGDTLVFVVDWFDHNNVWRHGRVEIRIAHRDKPRTLQILVNEVKVAERESE